MQTRKVYESIYEYDSTARKLQKRVIEQEIEVKEKTKKISSLKKSKSILIPCILGVFALSLILTCRYTIINEKNVESLRLKSNLEKAEATLFSSKVAIEQKIDLNKIESYAKQQLGMQKPSKNQIIYVDTSKNIGTVEVVKDENFFSGIKSSVLNFINDIF